MTAGNETNTQPTKLQKCQNKVKADIFVTITKFTDKFCFDIPIKCLSTHFDNNLLP